MIVNSVQIDSLNKNILDLSFEILIRNTISCYSTCCLGEMRCNGHILGLSNFQRNVTFHPSLLIFLCFLSLSNAFNYICVHVNRNCSSFVSAFPIKTIHSSFSCLYLMCIPSSKVSLVTLGASNYISIKNEVS